ncbi:helix-turn-helix transcriptional regulator [Niveispirillum sp.]|uniref:helix-turn-helix domain-containing protein n=1 Tax=Niveispirillum sp. TaxID=1917217 RepID=UPI001B45CAF8|nr:helix-turn-helix transcriptional regulator [Niveispirillum sp.]MBP7335096.1 helix-turn-helix transcriptional regulator [Niveispirillum sp.]
MGEIVSIQIAQLKAARPEATDNALRERMTALRERRAAWGRIIRQQRVDRGYTTRTLADAVGLPSPTLVSAIESGRGRLPDGVLAGWALAIGMEPSDFAAGYLSAFEPDAFAALRPNQEEGRPA